MWFGDIWLGVDDDWLEYLMLIWIVMFFVVGMGVGLLFWVVVELLIYFVFLKDKILVLMVVDFVFLVINFNWGIYVWVIYGMMVLIIVYFSFCCGMFMFVSVLVKSLFFGERWVLIVGWFFDFMVIVVIVIGVGGLIVMGVF